MTDPTEAIAAAGSPPTPRLHTAAVLELHRPYGLDCKCGIPINSDAAWALHAADAVLASLEPQILPALGDAWDDGNASGLDGWVGPGRGAGEVDDQAVFNRNRFLGRWVSSWTSGSGGA